MELSDWFKGFEKGIAQLSSEQRLIICSGYPCWLCQDSLLTLSFQLAVFAKTAYLLFILVHNRVFGLIPELLYGTRHLRIDVDVLPPADGGGIGRIQRLVRTRYLHSLIAACRGLAFGWLLACGNHRDAACHSQQPHPSSSVSNCYHIYNFYLIWSKGRRIHRGRRYLFVWDVFQNRK